MAKELDLFPFDTIRKGQKDFIENYTTCLNEKNNFLAHAPTGIGKTAASISPALLFALKNDKTVIFLTSRHTQHDIVLATLKQINEKHNIKIKIADLVGRKWMCLQDNVDKLNSGEFTEFCKNARENNKCKFYNNTKEKHKFTQQAKLAVDELKKLISSNCELINICKAREVCAYEIAMNLASQANIIIADYYFVFHPTISELFFNKTNKKLKDCIIIVDEGHNLIDRIMQTNTSKLTSTILRRAILEAEKNNLTETLQIINIIEDVIKRLSKELNVNSEKIITKNLFVSLINEQIDFSDAILELKNSSDLIREKQKYSYIGSIANFLESWNDNPTKGFARIIAIEQFNNIRNVVLTCNCLDPSIKSTDIIKEAYSVLLMSGTLNPTQMYADILGFNSPLQKIYKSPFPETNRLNLIVPKTTTKYASRNEDQFKNIANECANITNSVPGNSILFFPSYFLQKKVSNYFNTLSKKTIFSENSLLSKEEKATILNKFKSYCGVGSVLLAVVGGSFYEGIDLPGDLLKCVVIVGLPLSQPTLKTKELINYYDLKFKKGWDYGYLYPAFNKTMQSAGRCIRNEKDKGIIVFLDERYKWSNYFKCFPSDLKIKTTLTPKIEIENFFKK
ncbi:MAG: ATP-dependent DNA helicase [Candidatus Woesearchaeota archaeon]